VDRTCPLTDRRKFPSWNALPCRIEREKKSIKAGEKSYMKHSNFTKERAKTKRIYRDTPGTKRINKDTPGTKNTNQ